MTKADDTFDVRTDNPEMWNLLLRLSGDALEAVAYSVVEDGSLVRRRFGLGVVQPRQWLGAVEGVIYDNPALLSDFRRVYCVVETREYAVVPTALTETEGDQESRLRLLFGEAFPASGLEAVAEPTGMRGATVIAGFTPELRSFIGRTFQRVSMTSHISALCRYTAPRTGQGNKPRMIANIRPSSLDVIVSDGGSLLAANTFSFATDADAVYYLLALRKRLGLDPRSDELLLAGNQQTRERLTPMLRTYVGRVMPMIFPPQMFKAGKEAMLAPFDLIISPLCE